MSSKYLLKYRTFDSLMDTVEDSMQVYSAEGLIDRSQLIQDARRINKELGYRIEEEREQLLEVNNYKAKLPNDFHKLNFGLVCHKHSITTTLPGIHREDVTVDTCTPSSIELCQCPTVQQNSCCGNYKVVQHIKTETLEYTIVDILNLVRSRQYCSDGCPTIGFNNSSTAQIAGGYIHTSFESGSLYINYMANMENEDGELLVLDHELVNDYYEYSMKAKILENLILNKEVAERDIYMLMDSKAKEAGKFAKRFVNVPEYHELADAMEYNRKRAYSKYYNIFK
jgi:hypothetical protein